MSSTDKPISHETRFRVRYAETDQMGVVYHANYFVWMEVGRVELCRSQGTRYRDMEAGDGVRLAVAGASCRYVHPARYDEEVSVKAWIEEANPRMVRFGYQISSVETGRKLAEGETRHIFCNRQMKPARLPPKYHELFGIHHGERA